MVGWIFYMASMWLCDAVGKFICAKLTISLCDRAMQFQSTTHISPFLTLESSGAHRLERPAKSRRFVGSNHIWARTFFRVDVTSTFNIQFFSLPKSCRELCLSCSPGQKYIRYVRGLQKIGLTCQPVYKYHCPDGYLLVSCIICTLLNPSCSKSEHTIHCINQYTIDTGWKKLYYPLDCDLFGKTWQLESEV